MFWIFKLSFVVDILAFFDLATFWAILWKFWHFFSNLLVTLTKDRHFHLTIIFRKKNYFSKHILSRICRRAYLVCSCNFNKLECLSLPVTSTLVWYFQVCQELGPVEPFKRFHSLCIASEYSVRAKVTDSDKRSSLLRHISIKDLKIFYRTGPSVIKLFLSII